MSFKPGQDHNLPDLIEQLKSDTFLLVQSAEVISGIITRTDLNKPAIRVYLFGLVSLVEMHLSYWIRIEYPEESWKDVLGGKRLRKAAELQSLRTREGEVPMLVDCLQFCDKRDIILASGRLTEQHGLIPVESTMSRFEEVELLRNNLAHSQYNIAHGSKWVDVIALVAWMSAFVHESDRQVEARVGALSNMESSALW